MTFLAVVLSPVLLKLLLIAYFLLLFYTLIKILLDTHSTSKTLAYILLVVLVPLLGIILYFSVGINYRHNESKKRGKRSLDNINAQFKKNIPDYTNKLLDARMDEFGQYAQLVEFVHKIGGEYLSLNNLKLLINGEEKFPEVLKTLETATSFIHMEYYDWENDTRGNQIKDVLIRKVKEGVKVRVLFDDYASRKIKHNIVKELKANGIEIYPVIKLKLVAFANRINHRDHRKVIIMDGHTAFVGGINISDRYDNSIDTGLFWRDTHVKIMGPAVLNMQRHFIVNWNACQPDKLDVTEELFPTKNQDKTPENGELTQIVGGGPIYPLSNIMSTYFRIFTLAKKKLYVTNPYFIPNDSILNSLKEAAISGVDVRLMIPEKSDSAIVGAASKFYFEELLQTGVKIYMYKKGFVHAKTVVADDFLSVVGTANMDIRSFDLNFEIMSLNYGKSFSKELEGAFFNDLKECDELTYDEWIQNSILKKLTYSIARLISAFL